MGASGVCMTTPFSSATSQFIMRDQQAFRHDSIGSMFVHRTIITSLFVRFSVAATPAGRLPARERNTVTRKRRKIRLRTSHIPITVLYTLQRLLVSPRTRISPSGGSTGHRHLAQLVTNHHLNMVTNLHIAGPQTEPSRASSGYQSRAIPIWIPAD